MTLTFKEFIKQFDKEDAIVLLEGKRKVPVAEREKLSALGKLLMQNTEKMIFRSGNAGGSDQLFFEGAASIDHTRLQVIVPYPTHRKKTNTAYETISLDDIILSAESEVINQSKLNKKTETLIDKYVSGNKNSVTIKAAYIIRDTVKAIGANGIKPATFAIFYDDLNNPSSGGTGHTMNVCNQNNIPVIDQKVWFKWLEE